MKKGERVYRQRKMGRGRSKAGGGNPSVIALGGAIGAFNAAGGGNSTSPTGEPYSDLYVAPFQTQNDYTDNNNPALVKWQNQTDDKSASFLSKVDNQTDLNAIQSATNDPWAFYDNPQQKLVENLGLNGQTTVLSEADFNKYCAQTGATKLFRGWSGQNAVDRFKQSPNSHIGNGINGDGYYFSTDIGTAKGYGAVGMKAALSPNARVVSITAVRQQIANSSPKLRSALSKAGSYGTRTYGSNQGDAQMALKMGYNVIDAGWAVIPLTRDAIVVSDKKVWG